MTVFGTRATYAMIFLMKGQLLFLKLILNCFCKHNVKKMNDHVVNGLSSLINLNCLLNKQCNLRNMSIEMKKTTHDRLLCTTCDHFPWIVAEICFHGLDN